MKTKSRADSVKQPAGQRSVGRRRFISTMAMGVGAVTLGLHRSAGADSPKEPAATAMPEKTAGKRGALVPPDAPDAEVLALFGGLKAGTRLGTYTVDTVHGLYWGAIPVILRDSDGVRFQVDVLRRGLGQGGVGNTTQLSVYVANGGNGKVDTGNARGLGAMALAAGLGRREAAGARAPRELLTLDARTAKYPRGNFAAIS